MQKKQRHSRWYILTAIALTIAFVIIQLMLLADHTETQSVEEREVSLLENENVDSTYTSVDQYLQYISTYNFDKGELQAEAHIAHAVTYLSAALQDLSDEDLIQLNPSVIDQLNCQSNKLNTSSPEDNANVVKNTFNMISGTMQSVVLEDSERLQDEIDNLQKMASAIEGGLALDQQATEVSQFLAQTGLVLELFEVAA